MPHFPSWLRGLLASILALAAVFGHEQPEENAAPLDRATLSAANAPGVDWVARVDSEAKVNVGPTLEKIGPPPSEAPDASVDRFLRREQQRTLVASLRTRVPVATIPWVGIVALRI